MTDKPSHTPKIKRGSNTPADVENLPETVDPVAKAPKPATKGARKPRLSPQMREVIEIMAYEGVDMRTAAQRVGMHPNAAYRAWRRKTTKQAYNQLVADIRNNAGQEAYLRINHLSKTAKSEQIQLDGSKWVAGVSNIAPIKRVEGRFQHNHSFDGFAFDDEPVDITPDEDD